jgi:RNA polymerase sigma-70 factor, ECF subfamily
MDSQPDTLLEKAGRGDTAAANELIELFHERVYAFLRRLAGNETEAADLTQRTFARVWQASGSFARKSSASSWIHGIAYHVYVDWRRSNHRAEARPDEWWAACRAEGPGPDDAALRRDLSATVHAAVQRLDPDLRDTVHLHYYQELTLQETADALGLATSSVKYRLRQAIGELQKQLEPGGMKSMTKQVP